MQNKLYKRTVHFIVGMFACMPFASAQIYTSSDVPITIPSNAPSVITSTIDIVATNECIDDINVVNLDITHTWDNDLISP